ncbi:DUF397 domain-containing protein [Streptomyces sp. NPDC101225]|uniref:DUF397 domain-containing protein n=1 Tax=Streptomyces sp. NPDC101225 TaxID=3366135 RepID=UPI0038228AD3
MRSIPEATWFKSSYSGGSGGNCLEVSHDFPTHIPVRDSKTPQGPQLAFRPAAWKEFVEDLKHPAH